MVQDIHCRPLCGITSDTSYNIYYVNLSIILCSYNILIINYKLWRPLFKSWRRGPFSSRPGTHHKIFPGIRGFISFSSHFSLIFCGYRNSLTIQPFKYYPILDFIFGDYLCMYLLVLIIVKQPK